MIITIDGLPASGKTTLAKLLSKRMGFMYLESGAIYRSVTLACINNNVCADDSEGISDILRNIDIQLTPDSVFLNGKEVTDTLRYASVSKQVTSFACLPLVREFAKQMQLSIAENSSIVADGRDAGTKVFPDADVKFYLFASFQIRAWRRFYDFLKLNPSAIYEDIANDLHQREQSEKDLNIATFPLNAIIIDNTLQTPQETLSLMCKKIEKIKGIVF